MPSPLSTRTPRSTSSNMLEVVGLMRSIEGRTLFEGVSLKLAPGERLFVTGPSGVGKTLLLRAISCLDMMQVCKHGHAACMPAT